jgi:hypothetical protein
MFNTFHYCRAHAEVAENAFFEGSSVNCAGQSPHNGVYEDSFRFL